MSASDGWFQFCIAVEALASLHLCRGTHFWRIDNDIVAADGTPLRGQWDFGRTFEPSEVSRRRFWNKWTYDRTRFLAGRRRGQTDLKGFTWSFPATSGERGGVR
jgi:hypothetical protein